MQAVLVAGGKGKRLQPYTLVIPKPLIPINNEPIMEVIIKQLAHSGFTRLHICIGYLGELLQTYFGDGSKYGVTITYSKEAKPLGTIGPLTLINSLDDNFLVMNGDTLSDIDYRAFFQTHVESRALLSIATYAKKVKIELGVMEFDSQNRLRDYIEKPTLHYQVSTGIYALNKKILSLIPHNDYFDFPSLVKLLLGKGEAVHTFQHTGIWHDLGSIESFEAATEDYAKLVKHQDA
jgi:NDP-sugar pyrophosphorylase family protein